MNKTAYYKSSDIGQPTKDWRGKKKNVMYFPLVSGSGCILIMRASRGK